MKAKHLEVKLKISTFAYRLSNSEFFMIHHELTSNSFTVILILLQLPGVFVIMIICYVKLA